MEENYSKILNKGDVISRTSNGFEYNLIAGKIMMHMTDEFKFEVLARYFYYTENADDIPFIDLDEESKSFYCFLSFIYKEEKHADKFIQSLINKEDINYIKSVEDYVSIMNKEWDSSGNENN
ncbi:TPA: hypothetical protein U2Q77_000553 [Enterobacter hormaechei]|uniref:hypothetical protein n=1 Tax=Enterobacteriaceae TaxID=543 RepID=UPI001EC4CDF3|nr:hypothetical protein [Escherichia coli]HEM8715202.1 hypothetical protein [Enterobacter hormaechei]HEM8723154.1 hypothetical protein [Enterobacter hormaechei]